MVNAGSGIKMTATDLLRFGRCRCRRAARPISRVVPESWIDAGTTPQFSWRDQYARSAARRTDIYGGSLSRGDRCNFCLGLRRSVLYVVLSLDMVVVATTQWQESARK
jgi:CubicO group peptidase (beta-lactamase class C family)